MGYCKTSKRCNEPETLREAQSWQTRKNAYVKLGLCHRCASQAAYGHQTGFGPHEHVRAGQTVIEGVHPPCERCAPIVAAFPLPAAGAWRKHPDAIVPYRGRARGSHKAAVAAK